MLNFERLGIRDSLCQSLKKQDIIQPTKVQEIVIEKLLENRDVVAQSQTGTGKTLAYLLPIIQKIDLEAKQLQAVVLCPTQELAAQITHVARSLAEGEGLRVQMLIGGAALRRQVEKLKKSRPHFVIGTPGRIAELIRMGKLKMHQVRMLIIDEADQVYALSSLTDVEKVIVSVRRDCQLAFFSATIPPEVEQIALQRMEEPAIVRIDPEQKVASPIEHVRFMCEARDKIDLLKKIIRAYNPVSCMIFVQSTDKIAEVEAKLSYHGLQVVSLYGDGFKADRSQAMQKFRSGKAQCLIATDLAARGLDIPQASLIVHFDPPMHVEQYVHRAGRTGRAGQKGTSAMLLTLAQMRNVRRICKELGIELMEKKVYMGEIIPVQPGSHKSDPSRKSSDKAMKHSKSRNHPKQPSSKSKMSKSTRHHDRKNKGAPRWLKNKS